jgi:hypothetical protein
MTAETPSAAGTSRTERPLLTAVPEDVGDGVLDLDQLGSRIVGLAGRLAAATCRWLLLVARFDAEAGYAPHGLASTSRWLSHYCGMSRRTATDHVRVARLLAAHPRVRAQMAAGRLSYSQARAISRVADLGNATLVDDLIMVAEHGTVRHLEDVVRGLRTVDDNTRDDPRGAGEYLRRRWRPDSRWGLSARLDPENGAVVDAALAAVGAKEDVNQAEALVRIAEIALAALATAGDAPSLRGDQFAAVRIEVNSAALLAPDAADDAGALDVPHDEPAGSREPAESARPAEPARPAELAQPARPPRPAGRIADGPGLPRRVLDRLLCSGRIRTVLLDADRQPLDVGYNNRLVSTRQWVALLIRDGGCQHPGCGSRIGLEAHHVEHWYAGGPTVMANLVLLCRRHHHAHHEGEFTIAPAGRGRFRFALPDGRELPAHVDPTRAGTTDDPVERDYDGIPASAATTRWDGRPLDLDFAVAGLAQNLEVGRRSA